MAKPGPGSARRAAGPPSGVGTGQRPRGPETTADATDARAAEPTARDAHATARWADPPHGAQRASPQHDPSVRRAHAPPDAALGRAGARRTSPEAAGPGVRSVSPCQCRRS
jgi:hypothetical protein